LGREFRKVREQLEAGIRSQLGAVQENFGKIFAQEQVYFCFEYKYFFWFTLFLVPSTKISSFF
jgi:hypothetical protein